MSQKMTTAHHLTRDVKPNTVEGSKTLGRSIKLDMEREVIREGTHKFFINFRLSYL